MLTQILSSVQYSHTELYIYVNKTIKQIYISYNFMLDHDFKTVSF